MGRAFEYRRAAKEKRWASMSKVFPKLAKAITVAAKEGGTDPETNSKLRTAIANAKGQNMPKDNIAAAIKRAEGKDAADFTEVNYEGKGPHGVLVFVECATDNTTRTVANVKHYFSKAGGGLVPTGSLEFMFNRMAVFEFQKPEELDRDDLEMALIDGGLDELDNEDDKWFAYADYTSFGEMQKAFEELGIEPDSAMLKRFPTSPVEYTEEQMADIDKMLERIDDDDDVQAVYTNIG
ncbi:MAG: YebC/PmpR family DNA-binding transcriptional regulator [Bacteroidetes bacterium]|nr:YebC/PmpR family DNA-binding transcriptional regulator [Bacteroidota bacterium]